MIFVTKSENTEGIVDVRVGIRRKRGTNCEIKRDVLTGLKEN